MNKLIALYSSKMYSKWYRFVLYKFMSKETRSHIAMFHNVVLDDDEKTDAFACKLSELNDYVSHCQSVGLEFVSLDTFLSNKNCQHQAVITFDDGFASVFNIVLPYFKEKNIPFTVYVTTSYIGQKGYLTIEQLRILSKEQNCTIGMHAHEHLMFRYESEAKLESDFDRCRQGIQDITGNTPIHFAFPYGSRYAVSRRNCEIVRKKGVVSIALTDALKIRKRDFKQPYGLPRLNIPGYYNGMVPKKYRGLEIGIDD